MSLRSMTGFGRAQRSVAGADGKDGAMVVVEARSVNHKGLEVKLKAPRQLSGLEASIIKAAKAKLERGRVDVSIDVVQPKTQASSVIDVARVTAIVEAARAAAAVAQVDPQLHIGQLLTLPGALICVDDDSSVAAVDDVEAAVVSAADAAIDALVAARDDEGRALVAELSRRKAAIVGLVDAIAVRTAADVDAKKLKLQERLDGILGQFSEPARIAAEVALLAERLDVTEELARLRMHLEQLDVLMAVAGSGRRLDFLCQEFLREANTTASKCQDANTAHLVVELKAEIERLREQAQNVE